MDFGVLGCKIYTCSDSKFLVFFGTLNVKIQIYRLNFFSFSFFFFSAIHFLLFVFNNTVSDYQNNTYVM